MIESFEIEGGVTLRGYRTSGSRPGPHVLITAGIHGSEYPGILAARKLRAFLSQADIAGTVTVLPLCNPTALKEPKSRSKPSRYSSENDVLIEKSVKYTDFFLLSIVYV